MISRFSVGLDATTYQPGSLVSSHFQPSIVVASYFASLCGCVLTIEMLHRRGTALGNWRSWLETLGCASAMGLVGIWCMHFIGNRAIILGDGNSSIQLVYNAGYTTLSVFLPIIGLTIAFSAAEIYSKSQLYHWALLVCSGTFAGLSTVGMHYIGNFGITNYRLTYVKQYFAASVVIAIGDCILVLALFYTWREKWINSWWKRLLCAMTLAGGVSSMHFTASTKCKYRFRHMNEPGAIHSRNTQVTVAGVLCGAAAVTVLGVLFFTRHRRKVLKRTSQKVMLACAMFDPEGRILVTTEGILPAKEITDKYNHRSFDEEFDQSHIVFQWIFRVTRNWSSVSELIPKMKNHLDAHKLDSDKDSLSSASSAIYDPETYSDYSIIFRERFCAAAAYLASALNVPLERMGILYDKIVETGTLKHDEKGFMRHNSNLETEMDDIEKAISLNAFGKGQLLFLTRQLTLEDSERLLNSGYKFAQLQQVSRHIAETMQIPLVSLESHISGIRSYVDSGQKLEKPGTWLSCFAMIPKLYNKGFDVVVRKGTRSQLPDVQILQSDPLPWQASILSRMDGLRTRQCSSFLEDQLKGPYNHSPEEGLFVAKLQQAIIELGRLIPLEWFRDARFSAKPVYAHYSDINSGRSITTTRVYAFCVIADMHTSIDTGAPITRIPLSFLSCTQRCYAGSPDHNILAHDIHQEFSPMLARKAIVKPTFSGLKKVVIHKSRSSTRLSKAQSKKTIHLRRSTSINNSDGSSAHELVTSKKMYHQTRETLPRRSSYGEQESHWGGILVNSETVVKTDTKDQLSNDAKSSIGMGIQVAVGTSKQEDTFVDELTAVTKARFVPPMTGH